MIEYFEIPPLASQAHRVTVDRFTYGNPKFLMWDEKERIDIGSFCSIADEVVIPGGGEHRPDWITTFPLRIAFDDERAGKDGHAATKGTTTIGHNVWIGYRAMILSGANVGNGAVIGAGSVVTRDVPPYAICAANPSRPLRYRFTGEVIEKLQHLRWWDWELTEFRNKVDVPSSPNVEALFRDLQ